MVEDSFEDAREHGIEPETALRSHAMYLKWHEVIEGYFPDALTGNEEQLQPVIIGAAALLGELVGIVWSDTDEETSRSVLQHAFSLAEKKMVSFVEEIAKLKREGEQ